MQERVEWALRKAALRDEVKDKLNQSGLSLSGGQQQRLCIARTIAVKPDVLLLDEPTSALDPISTAKVEELLNELKREYTIAIVTHDMQHTHTQFDTDLYALRCATTTMAADVERQFLRSVDAIRAQDIGLASKVLIEETAINEMHVQIDLRCNQIIAKRQPIAVDLREILAILHINSDLERIGDEAKKIAFKVRELKNRTQPIELSGLVQMTNIVCEMLRESVRAFVNHDAHVATVPRIRDAEVGQLRDQRIADLLQAMRRDPENVSAALALVFVVQSIERVGDHAKNIAEYVVNVVEGIDARHGGPKGLVPYRS